MIKNTIKKICNCFRTIKNKSQPGTRRKTLENVIDHFTHLDFHPKTIIDVGIAYGTPGLYGKFQNVKYLLIEPLHEYKHILDETCEQYDADYIIAAASNQPGKITLNVHPDLSGSSLYSETEGNHVDGTPREVLAVTIDDLCQEKKLIGPYIIKIDVQGAELDVLDGAVQVLPKTEIIILEVSLFQFFKDGPQFYDVVKFMKEQGFVVYDIFGGHNRLLDDALGQIDLVFTKENGFFRKSHDFASKKQREEFTKKRRAYLNPKK